MSLNKGSENVYAATKKDYDETMIGVISENPSIVLNSPSVGPPVALAGRVNVLVKKGEPLIKSGDFLTSSKGGFAILTYQAGPTIGFAVENQKEGANFVEIILQPGRYYTPSIVVDESVEKGVKKATGQNNRKNDVDTNDFDLPPGKYKTINGVPEALLNKEKK